MLIFSGIHQFLGQGIVRVGGRSSSEILKKFNLKEIRAGQGIRRNQPLHIRRAIGEVSCNNILFFSLKYSMYSI